MVIPVLGRWERRRETELFPLELDPSQSMIEC